MTTFAEVALVLTTVALGLAAALGVLAFIVRVVIRVLDPDDYGG